MCSSGGGFVRGVFGVTVSVVDEPVSLDALWAADVCDVSDGGLVEVMVSARRSASRARAVELAAVAELARRREAEDEMSGVGVICARDYLNDEVAAALSLTAASADELIRFATELTGRLPATFTALAGGELDYAKARALWQATAQVSAEVAAEIEARVLPRAREQTTGEIRAKVRRLVRRLDPGALARRRQDAERRRDVELMHTDDGTAQLSGLDLPADAATAAHNRVNAIAAGLKTDGDQRGIGQIRADVFLALLCGTLTTTQPPADPTHQLAAPLTRQHDDWTAADDAVADAIAHAAREQLTTMPGHAVPGHAVPGRHQQLAELIAQAGERITDALAGLKTGWCARTFTTSPGHSHQDDDRQHDDLPHDDLPHDGGQGGQHGHDGYRVPARMRRIIEHRDRRCGFPGCRRPIRHCDADHTIAHHRGGPTCPCNLAMLCRHHHKLKQTPGWRLHQPWPGVLLWITPTGHWRITTPTDRE
jgi:Domain of unknown function (DUF222)